VVCDRESVGKYSAELHDQARDKVKVNGVRIVFPNVCFEVWILLHFQKTVAAYDGCDDLLKKSPLKKHGKGYDKGEKLEFAEEEVSAARKNAENLNKQTIAAANSGWNKEHQWNPYADIYKLLDAIDSFGKTHITGI